MEFCICYYIGGKIILWGIYHWLMARCGSTTEFSTKKMLLCLAGGLCCGVASLLIPYLIFLAVAKWYQTATTLVVEAFLLLLWFMFWYEVKTLGGLLTGVWKYEDYSSKLFGFKQSGILRVILEILMALIDYGAKRENNYWESDAYKAACYEQDQKKF